MCRPCHFRIPLWDPARCAKPIKKDLDHQLQERIKRHDRVSQVVWPIFLLLISTGIVLTFVGAKTPCPLPHRLTGTFVILSSLVALPIALSTINCYYNLPDDIREPLEEQKKKKAKD